MSALLITNELPIPEQYRGDNSVVVHFTTQEEITSKCGPVPAGLYVLGCKFNPNVLYMPNPCKDKDVENPASYAHLLCHELAHVNGWVHPAP
jgi:hypothetical protein